MYGIYIVFGEVNLSTSLTLSLQRASGDLKCHTIFRSHLMEFVTLVENDLSELPERLQMKNLQQFKNKEFQNKV